MRHRGKVLLNNGPTLITRFASSYFPRALRLRRLLECFLSWRKTRRIIHQLLDYACVAGHGAHMLQPHPSYCGQVGDHGGITGDRVRCDLADELLRDPDLWLRR